MFKNILLRFNNLRKSNQLFGQKQSKKYSSYFEYRINKLHYPVYVYLIGGNITIYLCWFSGIISKQFLMNNFTLNDYNKKRMYPLLTYSLSHNNLLHLLFNMVPVYFFGKQLEMLYGGTQLLKLYFGGSALGGLMLCMQNSSTNKYEQMQKPYYVYIGASGATYSIMTFYCLCFPQQIIILWVLPVPAYVLGTMLLCYTLLVDRNQAHFGGLLNGAILFMASKGKFNRLFK